jgi:hypothetical protein
LRPRVRRNSQSHLGCQSQRGLNLLLGPTGWHRPTKLNEERHLDTLELKYPINLMGAEGGAEKGDVVTRDGEFLGTWSFDKDEAEETGVFHFTAFGEAEPTFSEGVAFLTSGMLTGLAMSNLCRSIREWHDGQS